jgi:hypothetical protein
MCLIFQLISEAHNAYDYYGESDAEADFDDFSENALESKESQSSVEMSGVCIKSILYASNVKP